MRSKPSSPITKHRLGRLLAWARLWLCGFVGAFLYFDEAVQRRALNKAARHARAYIVLQAAARFRVPFRANHRHGRRHRSTVRRVAGSALRRALRARDPFARLAAILAVVRDAETYVARLLHRLRRGLTRLRIIPLSPATAPRIAHVASIAPALADTS